LSLHDIGAEKLLLHQIGASIPLFTIEHRLWHNALLEFRRMACFLLYDPPFAANYRL